MATVTFQDAKSGTNLTWRVKVGCINWQCPLATKAMSYALVNGEAIGIAYHATWSEAMDRANRLAAIYAKIGGPHVFKRVP